MLAGLVWVLAGWAWVLAGWAWDYMLKMRRSMQKLAHFDMANIDA